MDMLDIIILILLTFVIIYSVNTILSDKLSNIAINIPPISIPTPQITVRVQKSTNTNDQYDVYINDKIMTPQSEQIVSLSPIIEKFTVQQNTNSNESSEQLHNNSILNNCHENDVLTEYKKHQQYIKTYLEDPLMIGSNVNDYDSFSNIENIGRLDLTNGEIQPKPSGYVFNRLT